MNKIRLFWLSEDNVIIIFILIAMKTTLKDRFFTAPYLTEGDKNYIIMQVIIALYSLHNANLYHGSIKSSNILLSSFNHVWLTDIASYKPYYI